MTNLDHIRRLLGSIDEALKSLEHLCDDEIVGDDARHLSSDIRLALREHLWVKPETLEESLQLKPLYDRLKSVQTGLRVMRNTLDRADAHIEQAIDDCNGISNAVEEVSPDDEDL